jgi:hypothetical protein
MPGRWRRRRDPASCSQDRASREQASASAPDLPVADLVAGRVPRNEKAPATWTVQCDPAIRIRASRGGGMPDTARRAANLLCPGLGRTAALPVASGSFLSLDRRMPTCQLSPRFGLGQSAPPSFRSRHGRTCFDTRRGGGQLLARVRLSQPSADGRNTPGTGAPQ